MRLSPDGVRMTVAGAGCGLFVASIALAAQYTDLSGGARCTAAAKVLTWSAEPPELARRSHQLQLIV